MDNKHIINTTEKNVVSHATINYENSVEHLEEVSKDFYKVNNDSHFCDKSNDSKDATSIVSPSTALPIK